jgi:hypothetical protein
MTETTVAYHSDGPRAARPAVNVKVHGFDRAAFDALSAALDEPELGQYQNRAERLYQMAEEVTFEIFWSGAEAEAARRGLGPIEQEGRSGGWLVLTDGRDPQDESTFDVGGLDPDDDDIVEQRGAATEWLAAYRELAAWCAERVQAAPGEIARGARSMAIDEVAAGSVTLRSWLAFGKDGTL